MQFVMSYSCGKDSTLALHRMLEAGHRPVGLLIMVNAAAGRSYFHGADVPLLENFSRALELPLFLCPSRGEDYHLAFEEGARRAKAAGAEAICFGDIDIAENRAWGVARCEAVGLSWEYPLWQQDRRAVVEEILEKGYRCLVKGIDNRLLPREILGQPLSPQLLRQMEGCGIDLCGENGEYHTLAVDGPVFRRPLSYTLGEKLDFGDHSVIDIQ